MLLDRKGIPEIELKVLNFIDFIITIIYTIHLFTIICILGPTKYNIIKFHNYSKYLVIIY